MAAKGGASQHASSGQGGLILRPLQSKGTGSGGRDRIEVPLGEYPFSAEGFEGVGPRFL